MIEDITVELAVPVGDLLEHLGTGSPIRFGSSEFETVEKLRDRARWITNYLNCVYHSQEIVRGILKELTKREIDDSVRVEPPFYTGIGLNIEIGSFVQIGQSCHLDDIGGIRIGDGCIIDPGVFVCTVTRDAELNARYDLCPSPVMIQNNVWIGAHSTLLPGVTVGERAVVLPGSVVMYDVLPGTIFGGVPAQYLRDN